MANWECGLVQFWIGKELFCCCSTNPANIETLNDCWLNVESRHPVMVQKLFQNQSCADVWDINWPSVGRPYWVSQWRQNMSVMITSLVDDETNWPVLPKAFYIMINNRAETRKNSLESQIYSFHQWHIWCWCRLRAYSQNTLRFIILWE